MIEVAKKTHHKHSSRKGYRKLLDSLAATPPCTGSRPGG